MDEIYAIGLDYGTESARAILVDVRSGQIIAKSTEVYPDGVISEKLPQSDIVLPNNWALQNPNDWLFVATKLVKEIVSSQLIKPEQVIGLGIDFTSCTLLPVLADGTPLCWLDGLRSEPHAWPKLWKHHSPQNQADRITQLAQKNDQRWLERYGGKVSSEWLLPKALELIEEKPELYEKTEYLVEAADWLTWQLTGRLTRNTCCAGYKGTWHKKEGYPSKKFLKLINPDLANLFEEKVKGSMLAPGKKVANLTQEWSEKFGLSRECAVSAGIIDAHSAAIGSGLGGSGSMFLIMGTSTCHMLMSEKEVLVEGISGVVEDGIVPGLFGYEAGQVSVGDIFAWFVDNCVPNEYKNKAIKEDKSVHDILSEKAVKFKPGEIGLVSLDWWNGCRTPLVDADLTGLILGLNLRTKPEEIYRALIEGTAFGTRMIIDLFENAGISISDLKVSGGLTKNKFLLQIYADTVNLPIEVASSQLSSALGAAILGSVAGGYYESISKAIEKMVIPSKKIITPNLEKHEIYSMVYNEYRELVKIFGRNIDSPMKRIIEISNTVKTI